jgi:DNA-binding protein H-NS
VLRAVVENQGRSVRTAQSTGALRPGFTAADCTGETMITGADGVMVPLVTEGQKRKRRRTESAKPACRQAGRTATWPGRGETTRPWVG